MLVNHGIIHKESFTKEEHYQVAFLYLK